MLNHGIRSSCLERGKRREGCHGRTLLCSSVAVFGVELNFQMPGKFRVADPKRLQRPLHGDGITLPCSTRLQYSSGKTRLRSTFGLRRRATKYASFDSCEGGQSFGSVVGAASVTQAAHF